MRIVHICQRDSPDTGGSIRVAEALVQQQRKQGVDAWILFLYGSASHISKSLAPGSLNLGIDSSRQMLKGIVRLSKAIRCVRPDVIHLHDGIIWPRLAIFTCRCPIVMHAHLPASGSVMSRVLVKLTTTHLIGISTDTVNSWRQAGIRASRISYMPNGVNSKRFDIPSDEEKAALRKALSLPADKRILLWVGRLHRAMKGVDRVEKIAAILQDNVVLVVVGNGPEYDGMLQRCSLYVEQGKLLVVGATSTPENYFKAADCFLFTSYYEPFGLVILEAVASGLPIICFPVHQGGGAVKLLREFDASWLEDDVNQAVFERQLEHSVVKLDACAELRENVKIRYSWPTIARQVIRIYRTLMNLNEQLDSGSHKVLVCQHGARHRYAIPRVLEQEGMLAALYTDSSAESPLGQFSSMFSRLLPSLFSGLAGRQIIGVPLKKIFSFDSPLLRRMFGGNSSRKKSALHADKEYGDFLSEKFISAGLQNADIIYSMNRSNLDFVRFAKSSGCKSIIDIFISPLSEQVVLEESLRFPDWALRGAEAEYELGLSLWKETAAIGDLLLCPSEWVAEGIRKVAPGAAHKIRIVPYGCSIDYNGRINRPVKGRVLFAGVDALRKGLHYLASAATQLKGEIPELDVRVAGKLSRDVMNHPVAKDLNFIGKLGLEQMKEEYLSADVMVLPSLSEGFAGVVAEAIGAGCPVIVTKEAGSPVVHEREGLVVPSRDEKALAEAIKRLVTDRKFRDKCSMSCVEQIPYYYESQWKDRLLTAIKSLNW